MSRKQLSILIAGLLCWNLAGAQAYRWVDENGVTHYSQIPPLNEQVKVIKPPPPPPVSEEEAWRDLNQRWQKMKDNEAAREEAAEKKREQEKLAAIREKNCMAARHNLTVLDGPPNRLTRGPDGQYRRLTEEERLEAIAKAEEEVRLNCP